MFIIKGKVSGNYFNVDHQGWSWVYSKTEATPFESHKEAMEHILHYGLNAEIIDYKE